MAKDLVILFLPLAMLIVPLWSDADPAGSIMAVSQDRIVEVVKEGEERIYPLAQSPVSSRSGDRIEYVAEMAHPAGRMAGGKLILFGMAIDINSAAVGDLIAIPGVGPKTAKAIVDFRKRQGEFKTMDDLVKVKGIGKKRLAGMRSYIKI